MSEVDLLVVGGGPGGLNAARAYREAGGSGSVLVLSADADPPYARPPLSKGFLRGELPRERLFLVAPGWYGEQHVELRLRAPVAALDVARRRAVLEGGE